jgi:hypothetical protein
MAKSSGAFSCCGTGYGLRDAGRRHRLALDVDPDRLVQHFPREIGNRSRHRGAEKQRLAPFRQMAQHAADVGQKAHVQHPIGLVQHEDLGPVSLA